MKNKIVIFLVLFCVFAIQGFAQADDKVCLEQSEAQAIYALAAIGKAHNTYVEKAEADIRERDEIINRLKIELAKSVQENISLSNQAIRDNAALEQYRQFFFTKGRKKCIGIICLQTGN